MKRAECLQFFGGPRAWVACALHNSSAILIFSFRKVSLIVETNMKVSCTGTHTTENSPFVLNDLHVLIYYQTNQFSEEL